MKPPRGGLRPIHNRRVDVAKVELRIPAGGTLSVQDDVAEQLLGTGDFTEGAASDATLDALDEHHYKRFPDDRPKKPKADDSPAKKVPAKKV